jgi:hypothetical protein
MPENRVSAQLGEAERQAVFAAIETIRQKLPFLIDLTPEERRALPKMGDKSRGFVTQALEVATLNPDMLPRSFDVGEMRNDVDLLNALTPVVSALAQLFELVEDTYIAVGSDAYGAALMVYASARAAGKGSGLDSALDILGQRFMRKSRNTPSDGGTTNKS